MLTCHICHEQLWNVLTMVTVAMGTETYVLNSSSEIDKDSWVTEVMNITALSWKTNMRIAIAALSGCNIMLAYRETWELP